MQDRRYKALTRFATAEFGTLRGEAASFLADWMAGEPGLEPRYQQLLGEHGDRWLKVLGEVASAHGLRPATMDLG